MQRHVSSRGIDGKHNSLDSAEFIGFYLLDTMLNASWAAYRPPRFSIASKLFLRNSTIITEKLGGEQLAKGICTDESRRTIP